MKKPYDCIIRYGMIYDGSGEAPFQADIAINGQFIEKIGDLSDARAVKEIDAKGLAVSPGFINVLSWSNISLIADGRSQGDIRQGVTLEILGEGNSEGPLNEEMKKETIARQGDIKYDVCWTTLGEYLDHLEKRGISTNVASYLGAETLRVYAIGYADRPPTAEELETMRSLVRQAMEEGAIGMSSALIYPPGSYAETEELVELCKVVAEYEGIYISHVRNEGTQLLEALDELIEITRKANIRSEIYHLKVTGQKNWPKMDEAIKKVNQARAEGLQITADMYTYPASGTGLGATMPDWSQEGGHEAWIKRLKDPQTRQRIKTDMTSDTDTWDNSFKNAGGAENIILSRFKTEALKPLIGKTLAEISEMRGTDPADTIMDLVIEDDSNPGAIYFTMSEDNLRKQVQVPWVSVGSDAASMAPEGVFIKSGTHPRAYGTFARFLGKYVRDENLISLEEGVRRLTSLPAEVRKLDRRGRLKAGYYADVVIFDPAKVQDHATFAQPHQYASGMVHVVVNGTQVLDKGEHTGAKPGQVVRGPGYKGK